MAQKLLNDQPIGEGDLSLSDGLGFKTYARVLANAAIQTKGPFTIGIFGEWGTGKTSLMRFVESNLAARSDTVTIWFNAWRYEQEEHPIVPLVGTIVRALEAEKRFLAKLADGGQSLLRALRAVAYGFSAKSKVKVPGFAEIEASFVAKDMIERQEKLTPDPLLDQSLYYQAFEQLSGITLPTKNRIVVLIDDLDRCFPDSAIRLLEGIKLVLAQPGFVFVLGVARQVIEGYLQHRYRKVYGIAGFQGAAYLDKIVQLPFHIPPHVGRMERFSAAVLARLEREQQDQLTEILPIVGSALGANPRAIIRFVNNILVDLAIAAELASEGEMQVVPVGYFAVSRCLQQRWQEVFLWLSSSDRIADSVAHWKDEDIQRHAASDDPELSQIARKLVSEWSLRQLLQTTHGQLWLKNHPLREAAIQFLETQRRDEAVSKEEAARRYDVFLSYTAEDREHVVKIANLLSQSGVRVFWDAFVRPGENWQEVLNSAISTCKAIVFCFGERTTPSRYIETEMGVGVDRRAREGTLLVPIILPGGSWEKVPAGLRSFQGVDLREGISQERLQPLIRSLGGRSESTAEARK